MSTHTTARGGAVAENYGQAIFDLALEADKADRVLEELQAVRGLIDSHADLRTLLEHPLVDIQKRAGSIQKLFASRVDDLTLRFLLVLNRKRRFSHFAAIVDAFDRRLKQHRGQIDVEVTTATPMDEAQKAQVATRLSSALGKQAVVHTHVDASLIGGLKVRVGDRLIDASVASRLRRISRTLVDSGFEKTRVNVQRLVS